MAHLTEFKPRKSNYGFKGSLHNETYLDVAECILKAIGKPEAGNTAWWVELNTNMGSRDILIYINDKLIYDALFKALEQ